MVFGRLPLYLNQKLLHNAKIMGQYYRAVVLPPLSSNKSEIVAAYIPEKYGSGSKLLEHAWKGNNFVQTVESFFLPGEKFHKFRLVWAGDYADPEEGNEQNLYDLSDEKVETTRNRKVKKEFRYIVNHTKRLYVDKSKMVENKAGWTAHPLPLLTCDGNGRGGGDYRVKTPAEAELVGSWARDVISVENTIPTGFTEVNVSIIKPC